MPKWEEHYQVINNRHPFVDLVTEREAYAYGLTHGGMKECYTLGISKEYPYDKDRHDWQEVDWNEFPVWVQRRCEEVEPVLLLMKPME
jgi:hypothetical protein